jgi:hypothetical protein
MVGAHIGARVRASRWLCPPYKMARAAQIIRATNGIFRNAMVRPQLIESVPRKTIANFAPA